MRRLFLLLAAATSVGVTACGEGMQDDKSMESDTDIGASRDSLSDCVRNELVNVVAYAGPCTMRLMMNNFICAEGVLGQSSTELLSGPCNRPTAIVTTNLFGSNYEGRMDAASGNAAI